MLCFSTIHGLLWPSHNLSSRKQILQLVSGDPMVMDHNTAQCLYCRGRIVFPWLTDSSLSLLRALNYGNTLSISIQLSEKKKKVEVAKRFFIPTK